MRIALDDETRGEVARSRDIEDVGLSLRRFTFREVLECQRIRRERRGERADHQAGEVLFDAGEALRGRLRWRTASACRGCRIEQQLLANESGDARICILRRDLVLADELVRQLAVDLEFDGDKVVAANLTRAARGVERGDGG